MNVERFPHVEHMAYAREIQQVEKGEVLLGSPQSNEEDWQSVMTSQDRDRDPSLSADDITGQGPRSEC